MPICPGCEQTISYDRLDIHERYCDGIWSIDELGSPTIERLERRLVALEKRLDGRLQDLEVDVERRLLSLEQARRDRGTRRK